MEKKHQQGKQCKFLHLLEIWNNQTCIEWEKNKQIMSTPALIF